jgi:hypothetical protein
MRSGRAGLPGRQQAPRALQGTVDLGIADHGDTRVERRHALKGNTSV